MTNNSIAKHIRIAHSYGSWIVICFLLLVAPSMAGKAADTVAREELIGAYIFNLAKNVTWPQERNIKKFHIHVIEREPRIGAVLKRLVNGLKIKGLPITVTTSTDPFTLPEDIQLIYLGNRLKQFNPRLITQTQSNPVLIISYDAAEDYPPIMIDLYQDTRHRIHFRINQEMLKARNLAIAPDLILLGGKEIAVNRLFKSTLEKLREQQQRIDANRLALERMKREISARKIELKRKQQEIVRLKQQVETSKQKLAELKSSLNEKTTELITLQHKLLQVQQLAQELQTQSERYAQELAERRKKIEANSQILASQQNTIAKLDQTIRNQKQKISTQKEILAHQLAQLRQWTIIVILSTGLTLFALFFMGFFFWQRRRYQQLSRKLAGALEAPKRQMRQNPPSWPI